MQLGIANVCSTEQGRACGNTIHAFGMSLRISEMLPVALFSVGAYAHSKRFVRSLPARTFLRSVYGFYGVYGAQPVAVKLLSAISQVVSQTIN